MIQPSSLELRLKQGPNLKQMQRLIMSPQMQQAISLLQMPIIELSDRIDEELVQNPILENSDEASELESLEDLDTVAETFDLPSDVELTFDDLNFEILRRLDEDMREYFDQSGSYSSVRTQEEEKLKVFAENSVCARVTLFEHLMRQAHEAFDSPREMQMAEELIGNFNASGFLDVPLSEIALIGGFKEKELLAILEKIQQFHPFGIGARSLQESLLNQLRSVGKKETLAYQIVAKNYEELLHNQIPQILKTQGCTPEGIAYAIQEDICKLDLRPGASFSDLPMQPIVPDVTILLEDEKFTVNINDETVPSLRLNRRYMRYLDNPNIPAETKEFIKQKIVSAKWFLRNIHQRNETLEKIAFALIRHQHDFFIRPDGKLQPLIMKVLADELNVHESTIARAVSGKYLNSPRGLLPLRSFFTNAYVTEEGKDISSKTVREALLDIISAEDKQRPLSDEAISTSLKARGINCARRTVTKYRMALNLGNAHQRKKYTHNSS